MLITKNETVQVFKALSAMEPSQFRDCYFSGNRIRAAQKSFRFTLPLTTYGTPGTLTASETRELFLCVKGSLLPSGALKPGSTVITVLGVNVEGVTLYETEPLVAGTYLSGTLKEIDPRPINQIKGPDKKRIKGYITGLMMGLYRLFGRLIELGLVVPLDPLSVVDEELGLVVPLDPLSVVDDILSDSIGTSW